MVPNEGLRVMVMLDYILYQLQTDIGEDLRVLKRLI
jgi:hypothetical protein